MNILQLTLLRLVQPLFLRVDFRSGHWSASVEKAHFWLMMSAGIHIALLFLLGQLAFMDFLFAIAFPAFLWRLPPSLALAGAALNASLAIASVLVIVGMLVLGFSPSIVQMAAYLVQIWGVVALIKLALTYIRTAKSEIP